MTRVAPTLVNSFNMQLMPGMVAMRFLFCEPGQDFSSGAVVAWPALDVQLARNIATMILEETDPKKMAEQAIAAMKARAAATQAPANDEPPSAA
jgi:hypothetical protein